MRAHAGRFSLLAYREAGDPVERSHYQIAWLLARGRTAREVADAPAYSERWVREIASHEGEVKGSWMPLLGDLVL